MAEAAVPAVVPRSIPARERAELITSRASRRVPLPRLAALPTETSMLYRIPAVDEQSRVAEARSTHWLRHTTLTWVERHFGYAVARIFVGHTDGNGTDAGTTTAYIRAGLEEVSAALAALTGEPHPLALADGGERQ